MSKQTLYAYVDGYDLHDVADSVESRCEALASEGEWRLGAPTVVNQRGSDTNLRNDDLPSWDLGLNLVLPDKGKEPEGWFLDIERIARFLGLLHTQVGRDFIIGIATNATGVAEDLFTVDSNEPDLSRLRQIVGVGGSSGT